MFNFAETPVFRIDMRRLIYILRARARAAVATIARESSTRAKINSVQILPEVTVCTSADIFGLHVRIGDGRCMISTRV